MKKLLFLTVLCLFTASGTVLAADCVGDNWPADIDKDCRVQFDDYAKLAGNWGGSTPGPYIDPCGTPIIVEAEDCILAGLADTGAAYGSEGLTTVWIASDPCNGYHINTSGTAGLTFPDAIPDGDYILKMTYKTVSWSPPFQSYAWALTNTSGSLIENGTDLGGA